MSSNKGPLPDFSALQAAIAPSEPEMDSSTATASEPAETPVPAAVDVLPSFSLNTKPVKKQPAAKPEPKPEPVAKAPVKPTKTDSIALPDFAIKAQEPSKPVEVKAAQPVIAVKPTEPVAKAIAPVAVQPAAKPVVKKQTGIAAEVAGLQDFAAAITGETKVASPAAVTAPVTIESTAMPTIGVTTGTSSASVTPAAKEIKPAAAATVAAPKTTSVKSKSIAVRGQQLTPVIADVAAGVAFAGAAGALYQGIANGDLLAAVSPVAMLVVAGAAMLSLALIARLLIKLNEQHG